MKVEFRNSQLEAVAYGFASLTDRDAEVEEWIRSLASRSMAGLPLEDGDPPPPAVIDRWIATGDFAAWIEHVAARDPEVRDDLLAPIAARFADRRSVSDEAWQWRSATMEKKVEPPIS